MEIVTVVFLGIWLMFFCLVSYKQIKKEFNSFTKKEKGEDK